VRLLIVGHPGQVHVGHHFECAAQSLGIDVRILDFRTAYGKGLIQRIAWRFDRTPCYRKKFEQSFAANVAEFKPDLVFVTGLMPLRAASIAAVKKSGIPVVNFLTDDPWNPLHKSRWFMQSMGGYSHIFTPRKASLGDLGQHKIQATYLPFGYNPRYHYINPETKSGADCDVVFVGGADGDRLPFLQAMAAADLKVDVYGGYWSRSLSSQITPRGHADVETIRKATRSAKVNLILVRRANRDDHVMRTFEAAACGGCLVLEDTPDHRELFGSTRQSFQYFRTPNEAAVACRELVGNEELRVEMIQESLSRVGANLANSYEARLEQVLDVIKLGRGLKHVFA
jgi:spore maturation protein CgeB